MILVLVPLAGILVGLGLWGAMRVLGAFDVLGFEPSRGSPSVARERVPSNLRERVEDLPRGCLLSVIVAAGVWVLGWLVLLIVGLSLLG